MRSGSQRSIHALVANENVDFKGTIVKAWMLAASVELLE